MPKREAVWSKLKINPFAKEESPGKGLPPGAFALPGMAGGLNSNRQADDWNPFDEPPKEQKQSKDESFKFSDLIPARIRSSFSSKEKPKIKKPSEEALNKARADAIKASQELEAAMAEGDTTKSKRSSMSPDELVMDQEFLTLLEQRRKERDAEEVARADALRKEFLAKKSIEDAARAKELAVITAQKQAEEEAALQRKV
jgi:cysteinyl-tRNA synthetase